MPVVKLISNPNRSTNPYKGQFLNQIFNHDSEILKGRLAKEGKFIFTYYQQLIDLDDYLVEYFQKRVESKKESKIEWNFYEDLKSCFVYYKMKLDNDTELEAIWDELNILAKKIDQYVEEKMIVAHEQASKKSETYLTTIFQKAGQIVKELTTQTFFKRTMKLVSEWIQMIAKIRGLKVDVQTKSNLQGLKYDVFAVQLKESNLDVQAKNIEDIKQKYIQYDKAMTKIKLSALGGFTETKKEGDDTLEVAYPFLFIPQKTNIQSIIKMAKEEKLNQLFPNVVDFEIGDNIWITKETVLSLTNKTVDEYINLEKEKSYTSLEDDLAYAKLKDIVNQLSYFDTPAYTKSPLVNEKIKQIQDHNNRLTSVIFSEHFGEINATPDKSAYQVYQEMKAEAKLKAKFLKNAQPMLRGDTLSFVSKNKEISIQRVSDWERIIRVNNKLERDVELSNDLESNNPNRLTMQVKVLPVLVNKEKVNLVTTGKFKGFTLEDLTNVMGRFLGEGKSYSVDTDGKVISNFETLSLSDSSPVINNDVLEEPYITWSNGKFVLGLPVNANTERKSVKKLSLQTTTNGNYLFTASDYLSIKESLGSCLLSKKAHEELQKYYAKLEELDKSYNEENLKKYTAIAIGGFKNQLSPPQTQALSWLDGNDLKGLYCTNSDRDKMMVALGAIKIGLKKKPSAKFLIVTEDNNLGIFQAYIASELEGSDVVSDAVKEIGYTEFKKMVSKDYDFKGEFYALILDYRTEKNIQSVDHPRKIFLTLRELNKAPKELYRLAMLSQNQEIDPAKEKEFLNKYAVNIGGKFVGIKPEFSTSFTAWSKQNLHISSNTENISENRLFADMPKDIVKAYREIATDVKKQIIEMQDKYSDENSEEIKKQAQLALSEKIGLLNLFNINPNKAMVKYYKTIGKADQKFDLDNSKAFHVVDLAQRYLTKRIVYFTSDDDLAKEMVISLSHKIRGKIHVLCLTNYIQFYQDGLPLKKGKVTKQTDFKNFVLRTATEGSMDWIKKTIKDFIVDNQQVATLVCNSSYTNIKLKNFKMVVHLDEGGWDNNLMAKRKSSGDYQHEIILNSVYPDSTTEIDPIAINAKFYNQVLDTVLKTDQTISLPEQVKVSDQTSISKFKRTLMPTKQEMMVIDALKKSKKERPLSNTVLDPNRFNHPSVKDFLSQLPVSYKDEIFNLLDCSGASGILNVASDNINLTMLDHATWQSDFLETDPLNDDWIVSFSRSLEYDSVENKVFKANPCAPASLGNRALFTQLVAMKQNGKDNLYTYGVGDYRSFDEETGKGKPNAFIGYFIWPKFGYNADIRLDVGKLKEFAMMYSQARQEFFVLSKATAVKEKPVLKPMKLKKPDPLPSFQEMNFDPPEVSDFLNTCTKDLSRIYGNTPEYWKEQLDSYGYFKERNRLEESKYANENRLVLFYRERHNTVFPYHKKNLVDPKDIDFGHGKYFENRTMEEIVKKNGDISREENYLLSGQWNSLINAWGKNPRHKSAMEKLNAFYDGLSPLASDEEEIQIEYNKRVNTYNAQLEEYETELKDYELRKIEYETNLKIWEEQEKESAKHILPVDKAFLQNAILEKKFSDDIKFFMFSGRGWHKMGFARCAYYILNEIEKGLKIDDILDLYSITFIDENGKTIKAGEEWWKLVGHSLNYSLDIFDETSKSFKHLVSYMKTKVKEAGYETLEEYLSSPVEPFDVNSVECWQKFFGGEILSKTTIEEKTQILKTFSENLKRAYQKAVAPTALQLEQISFFESKYNIKVPLPFERKKITKPSILTRVGNKKASVPVKMKTFEQLMYQVADEDKEILDAITLKQKAEQQALKLEKEIKELKGDLKP